MFQPIKDFFNNPVVMSNLWLVLALVNVAFALVEIISGESGHVNIALAVGALAMSGVYSGEHTAINVAKAADEELDNLRREITILKMRIGDQDKIIMEGGSAKQRDL